MPKIANILQIQAPCFQFFFNNGTLMITCKKLPIGNFLRKSCQLATFCKARVLCEKEMSENYPIVLSSETIVTGTRINRCFSISTSTFSVVGCQICNIFKNSLFLFRLPLSDWNLYTHFLDAKYKLRHITFRQTINFCLGVWPYTKIFEIFQ